MEKLNSSIEKLEGCDANDARAVTGSSSDLTSSRATSTSDKTHRNLQNRHIQLIGIGGAIGTALFVQIGSALTKGGPGSLFLAFTYYCTIVMAVNNCLSEMVTWIPISSPFARYADRFVDPALGFVAGINFFVYEAILIPFEVTAFNLVLHFWTDKIPVEATISFVLVLYVAINFFAVKWYGESEFWLSLGKVILAVGLIFFTFVTMVGGNPLHDVYGFRNWDSSKVPGAPFAEYIETGSLGRFLGFLACLIQAAFTMVGPDYVSMTAGEAANPRHVLPKAFNSVIYRLATFFVVGSLCVGIVIPYNDSNLKLAISDARPGAGSSPYVIAMERLQIPVLPHLVNALILLSVFSAGNTYVYCASRTLFGLALEGKMPRVFTKCTKSGVPVYAVMMTIGIALLSFLQVSNGTAKVLQWFVNLVTASQLLNYTIISYTYIHFHRALKAQNIPRESLPKRSFWQPFCAWYAFIGTLTVALISGYEVFLPGRWDVATFFFSYTMIGVLPVLYVFWKVTRRTRIIPANKVSFFEEERAEVDDYEATYVPPPAPTTRIGRLYHYIF
ncbi:general amino acid permease AGP2 [Pleurotus eryngii]|uniref:General amino acid permease AGP2 n=1 Tax=Pleurotus eryngii TaxID=5323 RepID=A0A9P6A283_PLEER|nr:general amino acid permease AGP2 [Pleurotus eryngii]